MSWQTESEQPLSSTEIDITAITPHARVVAIDGPSGSGKGTISLAVARQLHWHYLDSGALYRVLGYLAEKNHIDVADEAELITLAQHLDIVFKEGAIWLHGEEIGDDIRTEEAGKRASVIAAVPRVREKLLVWQRSRAQAPGLVADGRDMGTVVFPSAMCKIFLTASAQTRAERRFNQLKMKGFDVSIDRLFRDISERDVRDVGRAVSPLKPAEDAILLDTTDLDIEKAVAEVMAEVTKRLATLKGIR